MHFCFFLLFYFKMLSFRNARFKLQILSAILFLFLFFTAFSMCEFEEQVNGYTHVAYDATDFTDDDDLRHRNPIAHGLSFDDEILFMVAKPSSNRKIPFGFTTTGCIIMSRSDRNRFRVTMLNFFEHNDFVKTTLDKFKLLRKYTINNLNNKLIYIFRTKIYV